MKRLSFILVLVVAVLASSFVDAHDEDLPPSVETEKTETIKTVEEIPYVSPTPSPSAYFAESFDDLSAYKSRWIPSDAKKDDADEAIAKYDGQWSVEAVSENALQGDLGLVLKSKAKHHAISARFSRPFVFDKKPLIVQYEVNLQNGQECGGAYLKLLTDAKDLNLKKFQDKTPYTIMFGPDKCGNDAKLHFIFRHRNPVNGTISEKHSKKPHAVLDEYFKDKKSHLYTLVLKPDNTYQVFVDNTIVNEGNLLDDFTPPVNPPEEIDDLNDVKPDDWDEREKIVDPEAKKPDDWNEDAPKQITDPKAVKPADWLDDESEMVSDPDAVKPSDWDEEMDGEWEAPLINNPKCEKIGCGEWKPPLIDNPDFKGKWYAPYIDNPNYQGKWKPKRIPNPHYFEDKHPFKMDSIGAVGFELWSMSDGIYFDNLLVVDDRSVAQQWASETWEIKKKKVDSEAVGLVDRLMDYTNSHPWLYAVYVVVIGLPIVLFAVFCCSSEDKSKKQSSSKKTDEITPDDQQGTSEDNLIEEDEEVEAVADEENTFKPPTPPRRSTRVKKSSLKIDEEEGAGDVSGHNSQAEEDANVEPVDDEAASNPEEPSGGDTTPGRSPRKRRARKE